MTFRNDIADLSRKLEITIETKRSLLISVDKRMSDALASQKYETLESSAQIDVLSAERTRLIDEIKQAQRQFAELTQEKHRLLDSVGLKATEIPAHINELPILYHNWMPHLHGVRSPRREQLTEKLLSVGLLAPHPATVSNQHAAA